jgi:hypothetical protein
MVTTVDHTGFSLWANLKTEDKHQCDMKLFSVNNLYLTTLVQ